MSNQLMTTAGGMLADPDEIDAFVNAAVAAGSQLSSGGVAFLKYAKGDWLLGKNGDTFPGNKFKCVPNFPMMQHGYQCWKDGQLVDEIWKSIREPLPLKSSLEDHGPYEQDGDGWAQGVRLDLVILPEDGVEERVRAQFNTSSSGGRRAMGDALKQFGSGLRANMGKVPVVQADSDSYRHTKYGKVFVPIFKIVEWRAYDEVKQWLEDAPTGAPAADAAAAKPAAAAKGKAGAKKPASTDDIPF